MKQYKPAKFLTRVSAMLPQNNYRFMDYHVEVKKHAGRSMTSAETDFISSLQRIPLGEVAQALLIHEKNAHNLELIRIGMTFHIYKDDFEPFLFKNKHEPKIKKALEIWRLVKSGQDTFKA